MPLAVGRGTALAVVGVSKVDTFNSYEKNCEGLQSLAVFIFVRS